LSLRVPRAITLAIEILGALLAGFVVYKSALRIGLTIPFDLSSKELLCLLLVIGPVIEELVFRGALWELFSCFTRSGCGLVAVTSLVFSFAHFFAWWSVPAFLR